MFARFLKSPLLIETALWLAAAFVCGFIYKWSAERADYVRQGIIRRYVEDLVSSGGNPSQYLPPDVVATLPHASVIPLVAGTACLLLPFLCKLIFGILPLELLRLKFTRPPGITVPSAVLDRESDQVDPQRKWIPTTNDALERLQRLASASKQIADKLYLRSGVYLLIGVLIAFSGLAFFYYQETSALSSLATAALVKTSPSVLDAPASGSTTSEQPDSREGAFRALKQKLDSVDFKGSLHTLARFGILFFIETIAFFFLRQYRTAMDEYRYFEAIKRRREENFVLLSLLASSDPLDLMKLPQQVSLYSDVAALGSGQTTDLLESRKLNKEETAILEKVVDAITKIKS